MNCELMIELMQRYVDDNLTVEEEQRLEAHVSTCGQCASTFARLKLLSAELEQLPKVKPRYSVVDSILPKLAEIDRQQQSEREESATLVNGDSVIEPYNKTRTRRFFTNISWKITGSVAVAACAALFFIWNTQTPSFNPEIANSLDPKEEAIKVIEPEQMIRTETSVKPPAAEDVKTKHLPPPEANKSIKPNDIIESQKLAPTPTKQPAVSALDHNDDKKISAYMGTQDVADPVQEPVGTNVGDQSETTSVPEEMESSSILDDQGVNEDALGQNMTYSVGETNKLLNRDLRIANDDYVAEVKDRKLTISTAATNELVYSSMRQWSDTESISSIVWIENNRLYYEVIDNQRVRGYLIDVALKTEMLIK